MTILAVMTISAIGCHARTEDTQEKVSLLVVSASGRTPKHRVYDEIVLVHEGRRTRIIDLKPHRLEAQWSIEVHRGRKEVLFSSQEVAFVYGGPPTIQPGIMRFDIATRALSHFSNADIISFSPTGQYLGIITRDGVEVIVYPDGKKIGSWAESSATGMSWKSNNVIIASDHHSFGEGSWIEIDIKNNSMTSVSAPPGEYRLRYSADGTKRAHMVLTPGEGYLIIKETANDRELARFPRLTREGRLQDYKWGPDGQLYYMRTTPDVISALLTLRSGTTIGRYDPDANRTSVVVRPHRYIRTFTFVSAEFAEEVIELTNKN